MEFSITTGVLQGDTLAPFLFIIVLDYILQNTEATTGTHLDELLPDLDFTNDIVLLDQGEMEDLEHFRTIAKKVGLSINYDKTKIMIRNIGNPRIEVIEEQIVINIADLSVKLHLFDSLIVSVLFYNSETWVTKKVMKKEVDSFGTSCYRYMLGIRIINRVRNEEVL